MHRNHYFAVLTIFALGACVEPPLIPAAEVSEAIEPVPAPGPALYAQRNMANVDIEDITMEVTDDGYRTESSSGCVWTESERYAPAATWSGCRSAGGSQSVTFEEGVLWPLAVGNRKTWSFTGRNDKGATWSESRTCEVEAVEIVTLPTEESRALKVVCEDPYARRIYWHSPELGVAVYSQTYHKQRNEYETTEYVAAES